MFFELLKKITNLVLSISDNSLIMIHIPVHEQKLSLKWKQNKLRQRLR